MKKILSIFTILAVCATSVVAQGINFEKGTWDDAVKKAKKENKIIFLDVYTTWCGPCKMMDKKTFADTEVGKYYSKNFVSFKIDAEKGEGVNIAKKYNVNAYPTNLFIDPNTGAIITDEKGFVPAHAFIERGKRALSKASKK